MTNKTIIEKIDPASPAALQMMDALWEEIQTRYEFRAPNPFDPVSFTGPRAGFWVAFFNKELVGSIAISPLSGQEAELDIMYVAPSCRGTGLAHELLIVLEQFARENNFKLVKLRTGLPQPEALRFYEKEGFYQIPLFGRWIGDDTALCFEKKIQA
jgi:GNAT superfamily N-acetyltransferase